MAKLTIGQKATRVLAFLLGLRNRRVAWNLAAHGFTAEDLTQGWALMQALTRGRLDVTASTLEPDPSLLAELDAWENKWFPIAAASLRTRFPAAHTALFNNLAQTDGAEVIISVGTFVERFGALDAASRTLLEQRGLTAAVVADAKRLLAALGSFDGVVEPLSGVTAEEEEAREVALWDWYLEWSGIARAVIRDRRALRALGFLTDQHGASTEGDDGDVVDPVADPAAPPVVVAPPRANGGTPATPRVEPGMPGSDPFDTRA